MQLKGPLFALLIAAFLPRAHAVQLRVASYNVKLGIESAGTSSHDAAKAVLARINADVVALQEVNLSDVTSGNPANLDEFASSLGYDHVFVPTGALDFQSRVVLISKFPFASNSTVSIVSPSPANDMTRAAAAAKIDVPGTTNDPVIITAHLKCCFEPDDPFRRAVEMIRIRQYLNAQGLDGSDNVFFVGDFNLLGGNQTFTSIPAGLPPSYELGNDIQFDVQYFSDPVDYFTNEGLVNPGYRQQNGTSSDTFISGGVLDHLLVSAAIASRSPMTEIFNSSLESSFAGLPKSGSALPAGTSAAASDHYPVFGDFELDGGLELNLTVAPSTLSEVSAPATLTVTLAAPQATTVEISLVSGDPSEAVPADSILTFAPGQTVKSTTLIPLSDGILDGPQTFQILASGTGFNGGSVDVTVNDADLASYSLSALNSPVSDTFENFVGGQSPAKWTTTGAAWIGQDDGNIPVQGARSYGSGSLGILTSSIASFTTTVRNDTGSPVTSLMVAYEASQWSSIQNGSANRWQVSVIENGEEKVLPGLEFLASTALPTGPVSPPLTQTKQAFVRGLDLQPNESIMMKFSAIPGQPGQVASDDVFINEFHYDNAGEDEGEFVEIVVGPAYSGNLADLVLYLYNGINGLPYGPEYPVSTFEAGEVTASGHRFFWKDISGIQNGSPDGLALVSEGTVRQFLSYEGTFTGSGGPATGLTSVRIGVEQSSGTPVGESSLALSGSGSDAQNFRWTTQPGPFTAGRINVGQSFGGAVEPQGIAIDHFSVTALIDSDGDFISDDEEAILGTNPLLADSDGDGQDDFFEVFLAETNPLSGSSFLKITLVHDSSGVLTVSVPTIAEKIYQIEHSLDLEIWEASEEFPGDGFPLMLAYPETAEMFFRVRISAP